MRTRPMAWLTAFVCVAAAACDGTNGAPSISQRQNAATLDGCEAQCQPVLSASKEQSAYQLCLRPACDTNATLDIPQKNDWDALAKWHAVRDWGGTWTIIARESYLDANETVDSYLFVLKKQDKSTATLTKDSVTAALLKGVHATTWDDKVVWYQLSIGPKAGPPVRFSGNGIPPEWTLWATVQRSFNTAEQTHARYFTALSPLVAFKDLKGNTLAYQAGIKAPIAKPKMIATAPTALATDENTKRWSRTLNDFANTVGEKQ